MTIALVAALLIGEFFTALVITLFVLVAEILEGLTVDRGRHAIKDLLDFLAQDRDRAPRRPDLRARPSRECARRLVLVNPGISSPSMGIVVAGHSFVDQASITGESLPVERRRRRCDVFAGTINQSGAVEVRADRAGARHELRQDHRGRRAGRAFARPHPAACRPACRLPGLLRHWGRRPHLPRDHARRPLYDLGHHRRRGVRHRRRYAAGDPGRHWPRRTTGRHHQGWAATSRALATVDTVALDKTGTLTFGTPAVVRSFPSPGSRSTTSSRPLLSRSDGRNIRSGGDPRVGLGARVSDRRT